MVGITVVGITATAAFAFLVNVPLGYWRVTLRRLTWRWFLALHVSIPFVIGLRLVLGISWLYVPLFIILAIAGQFVGSRLRSRAALTFM